jgi:hypothetical protein
VLAIGVVAGYEHSLPLPRQGGIRSKLFRRQMIEGFTRCALFLRIICFHGIRDERKVSGANQSELRT